MEKIARNPEAMLIFQFKNDPEEEAVVLSIAKLFERSVFIKLLFLLCFPSQLYPLKRSILQSEIDIGEKSKYLREIIKKLQFNNKLF